MARKAFLLLLDPPGLLLELRGNSPSGNESIVRNLGHLPSGGTVDDDDDVTHLDIPLPPPHHAQEKNTS